MTRALINQVTTGCTVEACVMGGGFYTGGTMGGLGSGGSGLNRAPQWEGIVETRGRVNMSEKLLPAVFGIRNAR